MPNPVIFGGLGATYKAYFGTIHISGSVGLDGHMVGLRIRDGGIAVGVSAVATEGYNAMRISVIDDTVMFFRMPLEKVMSKAKVSKKVKKTCLVGCMKPACKTSAGEG